MNLLIDGRGSDGHYRATCECGAAWTGEGEYIGLEGYCPAIAIADCIVHCRNVHGGVRANIEFAQRFRAWLVDYWSLAWSSDGDLGRSDTFATPVPPTR